MSEGAPATPYRDFDSRPPVPTDEYHQTVRRVNPGYELVFTLSHAYLRALGKSDLRLLIVGAGGGTELATFGPANPGWRFTGVDPSEQMLALARTQVEDLGITERVRLLQGTVDALPDEAAFDAATCIFVLQFVPGEEDKLALLQAITRRLRAGAPLLLVSPVRNPAEFEAFFDPWQQYVELMGLPSERMSQILAGIRAQPSGLSDDQYVAFLHRAGFQSVTCFFRAFIMAGWIAKQTAHSG